MKTIFVPFFLYFVCQYFSYLDDTYRFLQRSSNENSSWQGKFYYGNQNHRKTSGDSKWHTASLDTLIAHKLSEDRQVDEETREDSLPKIKAEDILVINSPKNVFGWQKNFYYCGPNP